MADGGPHTHLNLGSGPFRDAFASVTKSASSDNIPGPVAAPSESIDGVTHFFQNVFEWRSTVIGAGVTAGAIGIFVYCRLFNKLIKVFQSPEGSVAEEGQQQAEEGQAAGNNAAEGGEDNLAADRSHNEDEINQAAGGADAGEHVPLNPVPPADAQPKKSILKTSPKPKIQETPC